MKGLKKTIRRMARMVGYDIVKYKPRTHPLARRKRLLDAYDITVVLDVGANRGQYGKQLRGLGYKGKTISFEPLSAAFSELKKKTESDPLWDSYNFALGDKEETALINISKNSFSSSILDILPSHVESAPNSEYLGQEEIQVKTLDSIFPGMVKAGDKIYLKIDTQGFEEQVLKGGGESLSSIDTIQIEMSLTPLYSGGLLFDQMYKLLYDKGYRLVALEPGFTDEETGQLLQADGIFHRVQEQ